MKRAGRWTQCEVDRLRELATLGFQSPQIARLIGRTPGAVGHRAESLGIRLSRQKHLGTAPADRSIWDDADRLSIFANVPHELAEFVVASALSASIDLKTLRSSLKTADMVQCRQRIAVIARKSGYSFSVIGRALNRDHSTIRYAVHSDKSTLSTGKVPIPHFARDSEEEMIAA